MKHSVQIYLFILLLPSVIWAQKWDKTIGFSNTIDGLTDLLEYYDNGYLLSGGSEMYDGNWIIKTDVNGEILWDKIINHNDYTFALGKIDQNSLGEIVVARVLDSQNGDQWPAIVKLDHCGNKLWCRTFIDDEYSVGWFEDVILFEDGDVLALGYLFSDQNYNERIFLYYIDGNGDLVWRQSYASKENHPLLLERTGYGIQQFGNEYIIYGRCYYPHPWNPGLGYQRPFYIGIDNEFNEKWILPFGLNDTILGKAHNLIRLDDSTFMGVGARFLEGYEQNSLLMFFNDSGEELGYNQISNEIIGPDIKDNIISDIAFINDSMFLASVIYGPNEIGNPFGEFIIDTTGNIYRKESRPNTVGSSILVKTFDDKYTIGCSYEHSSSNYDIYLYKINDSLEMDTVYPGTYTYDSLCPYQIESGIIDITDCMLITDVGETPTQKEYFASLNSIPIKVYPNPTNTGSITLQFLNTEHHSNIELRYFNIHGEEVHSERIYQHQGESPINVGHWPKGMYLVIVYSDNKPVGRTKFIVR